MQKIIKTYDCDNIDDAHQWYKLHHPRGFIAAYKSMNKSSERTKIFKAFVQRRLKALHYHKIQRTFREQQLLAQSYQRLSNVPIVFPNKGIDIDYLKNYHIFFDTDANDDVFDELFSAKTDICKERWLVNEYLQTLSCQYGCRMMENRFSIIVILIPRDEVLCCSGNNAIKDYKTINDLILQNNKSSRGVKRQGISLQYATIGAHAGRCVHGISSRFSDNVTIESFIHFETIVRRIETLASTFLPVSIMEFAKKGKELVGCTESLTTNCNSVWTSAAMSYNYVSAAHVDDDSFLSAITVMVETDSAFYEKNSPIAVYFCLPECGIAIGLRPGDIIFFNPLYYHCISKRTKEYENSKVFVTSVYLKTAVIGRNDNRTTTEVSNDERNSK